MPPKLTNDASDPFLLLGLKRCFYLEPAVLEEAFRRVAASAHPDRSTGSTASFQDLQEATTLLRDPVKRLRYLSGMKELSSIPLPAAAMIFFPMVIAQLQSSDVLLKKYQSLHGSLAKATMFHELVHAQQEIKTTLSSLEQWHEALEQRLRELDATSEETSSQELLELAHSFNFAQRWLHQMRERTLMLDIV